MKNKIVTADEAVSLLRDRDTLSSCGFVQSCVPEALLKALERRYLKTGTPRNLSLFATAGQGDSKTKGLSRLGHEGLLRKVVAGNWGRMPSVCKLALDEKIYAYNLPQGIISKLFRDLAGGQPGTSPRSACTPTSIRGSAGARSTRSQERTSSSWSRSRRRMAVLQGDAHRRGVDPRHQRRPVGNLSMEKEALTLDGLAQAMAAHNNGGIVIAQVERIVDRRHPAPRTCEYPASSSTASWSPTPEAPHELARDIRSGAMPARCGLRSTSMPKMKLDERKIIARRCRLRAAAQRHHQSRRRRARGRRLRRQRRESAAIHHADGGIGRGRRHAGERRQLRRQPNMDAVIDQNQQFDFYDGGGLDMACLGMAECDRAGNVNVSRFGGRLDRCRRLHQYQPERPPRGVCRHFHRRRPRDRGRGRQAQDPQGRQAEEIRPPFQIRSATGQHRRDGGVSGGGKGRGQGL